MRAAQNGRGLNTDEHTHDLCVHTIVIPYSREETTLWTVQVKKNVVSVNITVHRAF